MACAATLAEAGISVEVFEKSGRVGGRLSTRKFGNTEIEIGAQYATARGPAFRTAIDRLIETGAAAPWQPGIRDVRLDDHEAIERRDPWFVGTPRMSELVPPLAHSGSIHTGCRVAGITQEPEGWFLSLDGGKTAGAFSAIAATAPAPQCLALIGDRDPIFETIAGVGMSPCWTVACHFERPVDISVDVVRPSRGAVTWSSRNSSKPGRDGECETWVIHGNPVWSLDHLEDGPEAIGKALLDAFAEATGTALPPASSVTTHRWRYARVEKPLGESHLLGCNGTLGAAGDWCLGARIEAAFDSGQALGRALADSVRADPPTTD